MRTPLIPNAAGVALAAGHLLASCEKYRRSRLMLGPLAPAEIARLVRYNFQRRTRDTIGPARTMLFS
jgi:hypothetical protein